MLIQPQSYAQLLGETGRPAKRGSDTGPAHLFSHIKDVVSLGETPRLGAGLYSGTPLFKIMGSVQLLTPESAPAAENAFGHATVLL